MDVSGRRQADSEDWNTCNPCDNCLIDNVNENAQFYCSNCDEFLCEACARSHRRNKASRQHRLLDKYEMPSMKMPNVQDKLCAKHDGKLIEYLCDKHDTFCCTVCVTLDHVQCGQCVKYIDDLATEFTCSHEYKSLLKQIKDTGKLLEEHKNNTLSDSVDVANCFGQLKADIQVFRSEINSRIDALEHELLQQAEQIKNEDMKTIDSAESLRKELLENISETSTTLELFEQFKQNQQLFISAKKAETQFKEYYDKAHTMLQENIVRRYVFLRNENILNTLNFPNTLGVLELNNEDDENIEKRGGHSEEGLIKENNPSIGMLSIGTTEKRQEEQHTNNTENVLRTDTFKPTQFKFMQDIKLKHKADTDKIWITGSVLVSNDILAVADRENYSIKVVDLPSDTIICYYKLDDKPLDITCMDSETLVVTYNTSLVFLRYKGQLSVVKKVPMDLGCSGIEYRKGKLFVTFDGEHPSIKILNHEGKVLQTFQHNENGQNMFVQPISITVNRAGDTMYVSDCKQDTVTSLNMDGRVCYVYKHERLSGPTCLTLGDDDDSIYVAGYVSHNIHQITSTCTTVRVVLGRKDGLRCPRTVLYNKTDKTLCVSNRHLPELKVYKLE